MFEPGENRKNGLGDTRFTAFLLPASEHGLIWGAGPVIQMPTNSDDPLGNDRWGLGASLRCPAHKKGAPGCTACGQQYPIGRLG
ncbi:MAG TPA: hypothetical protein VET88_10650 [Gammaproteobacteria bacterium]|nr:hypothetical protein [Gammaproteobacteria bacterium]